MHNLMNYDKDANSVKGIILESDLGAINYLKPGKNEELFNKLKQGARIGASMLAQMSQEHNLNVTQIFEENKAIIEPQKQVIKKMRR